MDEELFRIVFIKEFGVVDEIMKIEVEAGSKAGEHNLSEVSRVTVAFRTNGEEKSRSFIIKDITVEQRRIIRLSRGIEKECGWYVDVLPEVEKLSVDVCCRCYAKTDGILLLEDLCGAGYRVIDRHSMLDLNHCVKSVETLAKFHAVTHDLLLKNQLPDIVVKDTIFSLRSDFMDDWLKRVDKIIDSLNDIGVHEYDDTLKNFQRNGWDTLVNCLQNGGFLCLIHGDFWTTNILFKYDGSNQVDQAKIIDFQLIRLSIASYDLHFLITTSLQSEARNEDNLNRIYNAYLTELNRTLEYLGCDDILSKERFDKMMSDTSFFSVFTTLTFLPVLSSEKPLQFTPPQHLTQQERKNYSAFDVVYKQETYRKRLLSLLDYFVTNRII